MHVAFPILVYLLSLVMLGWGARVVRIRTIVADKQGVADVMTVLIDPCKRAFSASVIATRCRAPQSDIMTIVNWLRKKGYVERIERAGSQSDPSQFSITDSGIEYCRALRPQPAQPTSG